MSREKFATPYEGGFVAAETVKEEFIPQLLTQFADGVEVLETRFDIPELQVAGDALHDVASWLKERGFNMLVDVGGVDYLPREPRYEVVYHLLALPELWRLRLRVPLHGEAPEVATVSDLWESATHAEREVWDLFGVRFTNHPNLTRIMMPDNWVGHPLRKDYPLQGPRAAVPALAADRNRYHVTKRPAERPEHPLSPEKGAD